MASPPSLPAIFRDSPATAFKQRRAEATHRALLRAASKVFERQGFEGATIAEIASAAHVSIGAFYRHFPDKRSAFVEVLRSHLSTTLQGVLGLLRFEELQGDPRTVIETGIEILFQRSTRMVQLDRVYLSMSLRDPEVHKMRAEFESVGVDVMTYLIERGTSRTAIPNPRAAALVVSIAAYEVANERAGLRPRSGPSVEDADIKWALRELLYRFLYPSPNSQA